MATRKYINGATLPEAVERDERSFRACNSYVAAIDFGTTACSLAFCRGNEDVRRIKLEYEEDRVPTALLLDSNVQPLAFGKSARRTYANLPLEEKGNHYLFHQVKMKLQHDPVSNTSKFIA